MKHFQPFQYLIDYSINKNSLGAIIDEVASSFNKE